MLLLLVWFFIANLGMLPQLHFTLALFNYIFNKCVYFGEGFDGRRRCYEPSPRCSGEETNENVGRRLAFFQPAFTLLPFCQVV